MNLKGALKLANAIDFAVSAIIGAYGKDTSRSPYISDMYDFFRLSPSDFYITINLIESNSNVLLINLALMQDFSFNLNREVHLVTSLEAPFYVAVSNGRVSGSGYVSRIYTVPLALVDVKDKPEGLKVLDENLLTIYSRWLRLEKLFDNRTFIYLPFKGNEQRVQFGIEIYKNFDSVGLLQSLKDFSVGLAKSVVNKTLKAINEILPIASLLAYLDKNKELPVEKICGDCEFIQIVPVAYSFKSSAGTVAVFESMQFLITNVYFPNKLEKKGR